jgi:omega-amidase
MKISIVQYDIAWEDKSKNFDRIEQMVSGLKDSDIVILPETFNTGFSINTEKLSEPPGAETYEWLLQIAQKGNFGVCGSYVVKENDRFYNRWIFISPEKKSWFYDKRHLFCMGDEEREFTPGSDRLVFKFRGLRISANVCYDLRFPVWTRNRNDYDLLINSANWPLARHDVWITLLKARSLENQCFVAGANRVGTDAKGISYCGDSMVIDPFGKTLVSAGKSEERIITCEISLTQLNQFRNKFPVSKDADEFTIIT